MCWPPGTRQFGTPAIALQIVVATWLLAGCQSRAPELAAPKSAAAAPASGTANAPLSKAELVRGLNAVRPAVGACYDKYGEPGTAWLNVVIDQNGGVSSASVTGKFAGTPTGACVEAAVKRAHFQRADGSVAPGTYQLR